MNGKEEVLNILNNLYNDLLNKGFLDFNSDMLLQDIIDYIKRDIILDNSSIAMFTMGYYCQVIKVVSDKIKINESDKIKVSNYIEIARTIATLTE